MSITAYLILYGTGLFAYIICILIPSFYTKSQNIVYENIGYEIQVNLCTTHICGLYVLRWHVVVIVKKYVNHEV